MPDDQHVTDTLASLERVQVFDVSKLAQTQRLGLDLDFSAAIAPANRLIGLYKQLSPTIIQDLPKALSEQIRSCCDSDFNRFSQILEFDPNISSPRDTRDNLVLSLSNAYDRTFGILYPFISYSSSKVTDFQRLENEQRARIQAITDASEKLMQQLENQRADAERILASVRASAAEQGVSQQAIHFSTEANHHSTEAAWWLRATIICASIVFLWALLGPMGLSKIGYADVQLGVSKVLTFGVLSFLTYLSAKNFLNHKHNAIVNKHRQNALATFRALVDAAGNSNVADAVLTHASACIFSPQTTGYAGGKAVDGATAKSVVELIGKPVFGEN